MNQVSLADTCYVYFGTSSASTGAATNADSTPTVVVAEDGVDLAYAPTVTNVATGLYKAQIDATSANGFEAGRRYNVYAVATVGAITGRDGVGEFEVLAVDMNTALDAAITSRMASYTQPTGFLAATFPATVASTTNITAGTITTVSGNVNGSVGSVVGAVGSVTAAVTLPTIPADWITSAGIAAGAITSSEAPALANLDAAVTTRMASYTQPTGFLTATFPTTVASTTNITAGTITTATNLTNLPSIPANWLTAAGIEASALNGKGDWNVGKTGYTLVSGPLDAPGTRTALGLASANLDTQFGTLLTSASYTAPDNAGISTLTGRLTAGRATNLDNIDAAISSRLASAAYTAPDNVSVTAIKAKTDSLTFTVPAKLDVNLLVVNGVTVTGAGTAGNPWGPA